MGTIVEGKIAVKAVLNSKFRTVKEIYIEEDKKGKDVSYIIEQARIKKIEVKRMKEHQIQSLAKGKTRGGILAQVSERKTQSIISLLKKDKPFLALLEGIEDSYNLC